MSAKPKQMHQIRIIFQLKNAGFSIRKIANQTGMSRNTIREYLRLIESIGIDHKAALELSDEDFIELIYNPQSQNTRLPVGRIQLVLNKMDYYIEELRRTGVTKTLLWHEYRVEHPDGLSHSQFCWHLLQHQKRNIAIYKIHHAPGEQMMVDFAGDLLSYVDPETGEIKYCQVLVCVLPFSGMTYVEVLRSQKQPEFTRGICNALTYFGGVPLSIKCDNLKSAVVKANRYDPEFTQAMELLAIHYNTNMVASRVRKPRDKASVENAVKLAYQRIYAPLRDQIFKSIEELQCHVREQLIRHNTQRFQGKEYSRLEMFESQEKVLLQELPGEPYIFQQITFGKVQRNYHVILGQDFHQYSVPYTLIGKRLKILFTTSIVEIYDDLQRVAIHKRSFKQNGYTTLKDHMPANHQYMEQSKGWDSEYFIKQANQIGPYTSDIVEHILKSRTFIEQSYRSCIGVLRLANAYTPARLENACALIKNAAKINYGILERVLKNNMDKQDTIQEYTNITIITDHENLRGSSTYA